MIKIQILMYKYVLLPKNRSWAEQILQLPISKYPQNKSILGYVLQYSVRDFLSIKFLLFIVLPTKTAKIELQPPPPAPEYNPAKALQTKYRSKAQGFQKNFTVCLGVIPSLGI